MARKALIERQRRRERLVALKKERRAELKAIIRDPRSNYEQRMEAQSALSKLPRDSSRTRLKNRCALTGRGRGYMRKFRLSRIRFREMANEGLIPGITKASW